MPNEVKTSPNEDGKFELSPSQHRIASLLHKRFGSYYKDIFVDICRLMSQGHKYNSQRYLAGHLISELEGAIRSTLLPIVPEIKLEESETKELEKKKNRILSCLKTLEYPDPKGCAKVKAVIDNLKQPDNHSNQIKRIIEKLELDRENDSVNFWLEIYSSFQGLRHLPRGKNLRKIDDELDQTWEGFQKVLLYVLSGVEKRYTAFMEIITEIKDAPSEPNLKKLRFLPNNILTQRQFFDGNNNPGWLKYLSKAGYFKEPPPSEERFDDEKVVGAVYWPAAEYLTRMASSPDEVIQKQVFKIALAIPDTKNLWVNQEIMKMAKALPVKYSAQLFHKIKGCVEVLQGSHFFRDIAGVIKYWSENGKGEEGLKLTKEFLSLDITDEDEKDISKIRDDYEFRQVLGIIKDPLIKSNPLDTLICFCNFLDKALSFQYPEGNGDYLYIRLPDVGKDSEIFKDPISSIVITIRDGAIFAIYQNSLTFQQIEELLGKYKWNIFQRIIIFLASEFPEKAPETVSRFLLKNEGPGHVSKDKELRRLFLKGYPYLSQPNKDVIINRLENGPRDIEDFRNRFLEHKNREATKEDIEEYKNKWLRDMLKGWSKVLPQEWQDRYKKLVAKYGEGFEPGVVQGSLSPVDSEQLKSWSIDTLVNYLRTWEPSGKIMEPSLGGLRQELRKAFLEDTSHFLPNIEKFFCLHPSYIHGILSALSEVVRNNKGKVDWNKILSLCEWACSQRDEDLDEQSEEWDSDNTWKWVWLEIGNLIEAGFLSSNGEEIPIEYRNRIWSALDFLRDYKDQEEVTQTYSEEDDLYEKAVTTVAGQALQCIVKYGLWIRKFQEMENLEFSDFENGLTEVGKALEEGLSSERAQVSRSIYGRYFPWLQLMDRSWAAGNIQKIFSEPLTLDPSWRAYVSYSGGPYKDVFSLIKPLYEKAVGELASLPRIKDEYYYQIFGESLMVFMMWGNIDIDNDLISQYFSNSSDEDRGHAVWFAFRTLSQNGLDPEIVETIQRFANCRLDIISGLEDRSNYQTELKRYGLWIGSKHLDPDWQLGFLERVVALNAKLDGDEDIFEFLSQNFDKFSKRVIACLEKCLFESVIDYWEIEHNKGFISSILLDGLKHSENEIQMRAEEIRNRLVADGHLNFQNMENL